MNENESKPGQPSPGDASPPSAHPLVEAPPSCDAALCHAARLLYAAESETDRGLMERLEKLADSWLGVAAIQRERES